MPSVRCARAGVGGSNAGRGRCGARAEIFEARYSLSAISRRARIAKSNWNQQNNFREFIFKGNMAGILHTTIDGRILDCNEAILRIFGYSSKEELQAVRAPQLYADPEDRDRLLRLLSDLTGRARIRNLFPQTR